MQRVAVDAILDEWVLEHRRRGLPTLTLSDVQERLRVIVKEFGEDSDRQKRKSVAPVARAKMEICDAQGFHR